MKTKNHEILKNEWKRTIPIYIVGMFFHTIELYMLYKIPTIIGNLLDLLMQANNSKHLLMQEVYSLVLYSVCMIIPRIIFRTLYFTEARTSDTILRKKVIEHLQKVKPEYFDQEEKGTFLAYLSKEILSIRKFLGDSSFYFTKLVIAPILGLLIIGNSLNSLLSMILIPIFPVAMFVLWKLYQKYEKVIENERKVYVDFSNVIEQNTSGFSLIKLYNEQENQKKKFEIMNERTYQSDYNVGDIINQIDLVTESLYGLCYSLGFAIGLILIKKGLLTVGELTAYISCITLVIVQIVNSIKPLMDGFAFFKQATKRFNYFFHLETYSKEGEDLEEVHQLEIKNLSYAYQKNGSFALQNINMTIQAGEKIGIVGKIGSGKTTLMNIIAGFYEVPANQVFINEKDINSYSREAIFKNIGYATQKNIITDDTIKNNIDITEKASLEKIEEVARRADIYQDIANMQDGLETKIGENGMKVSGGQKQRIQIARNLLNIRKVNIFDDTLSALDVQTERKVFAEIEKQVGDNILIVISNKISMMEKMDKVYLLMDGKITDYGTHQELLQKNEFYKELNAYEKVGDLQ